MLMKRPPVRIQAALVRLVLDESQFVFLSVSLLLPFFVGFAFSLAGSLAGGSSLAGGGVRGEGATLSVVAEGAAGAGLLGAVAVLGAVAGIELAGRLSFSGAGEGRAAPEAAVAGRTLGCNAG
jgi:hypothetical protein